MGSRIDPYLHQRRSGSTLLYQLHKPNERFLRSRCRDRQRCRSPHRPSLNPIFFQEHCGRCCQRTRPIHPRHCPRRNSPICWILPTSRSSMLFSNITLLLALLHSSRTSQTVRGSRHSKEMMSLSRSTPLSGSTTQLPSLPISLRPTVSFTSSTKCSTLQLLASTLWTLLPPNQTFPPSSLPSRLASSLTTSQPRVRSLSSHQPTGRSPSCPRRNSPICWILPT